MHYHVPKPFFRKNRNCWYVQIDGRQIKLGKDRSQAFQRYYEIMASPPEERAEKATGCAGLLLSQLFDQFLDWVQRNRAEPTYEWYRYRLQRFADKQPNLTVEQLRPFHVQQWVDGYQNHTRTSNRNYMRTIKRCLTWAHRLGYIDRNPLAALELPAADSKEVYFPPEQFNEFLDNTVDQNLRDLMIVTYECGCRPQESLRLEVRHVDLAHQRWVIPRKEAKGKKAPRVVYLSEEATKIIKRLLLCRTDGFVFRNNRGNRWTPSSAKCSLHRVQVRIGLEKMKELGIKVSEDLISAKIKTLSKTRTRKGQVVPKTKAELHCEAKQKLTASLACEHAPTISLYALRHSWATNALKSGVDSLTVAILMGHQDPSMLAKVYQHLGHNPEHMLNEARKAVGEKLEREAS